MSNKKVFYWLRLKTDFFNSQEIDYLLSQENGSDYVVLYLMLMLKTINNGGLLGTELSEFIVPFDDEKIQRDCKYFSLDTIKVAFALYVKLGLVYKENEQSSLYRISDFNSVVGSETNFALAKRKQRSKYVLNTRASKRQIVSFVDLDRK